MLQTPVTVDVVEQPLGEVLKGVSATLKLDLSAEQNVADQRVTLHVAGQPAYMLMGKLLALLSHDADHPHGYYWGSLERVAGERPDYQLWRDGASVAREQQERDYPRRELAVFLREWRHMAQLSPKDFAAYKHDLPFIGIDPEDAFSKAFRDLTDAQIDALVNGETIPLDPMRFKEDIAAFKADPNPGFDHTGGPAIRVIPGSEEYNDEDPGKVTEFNVHLDGVRGDAIVLDTYDTTKDPDPGQFLPADAGPHVDLAPYLTAKTVTDRQRGDLGFTLQALAKAAHLNIYQESFLRTSVENGALHPGLTTLQGSVPRLVAQICSLWNYHAQAVPDGYLFWSRTWAQDRAVDVPERLLAPWRERLAKNGDLTVSDRAEIDAALTWPQVALTLDPALPEADDRGGFYAYRLLNLLGSLTPFEQAQAMQPGGMPLSELSARGQAALDNDYHPELQGLPNGSLGNAVLKFRREDSPELNIVRLVMNIEADGHKLLEERWGRETASKLLK